MGLLECAGRKLNAGHRGVGSGRKGLELSWANVPGVGATVYFVAGANEGSCMGGRLGFNNAAFGKDSAE